MTEPSPCGEGKCLYGFIFLTAHRSGVPGSSPPAAHQGPTPRRTLLIVLFGFESPDVVEHLLELGDVRASDPALAVELGQEREVLEPLGVLEPDACPGSECPLLVR